MLHNDKHFTWSRILSNIAVVSTEFISFSDSIAGKSFDVNVPQEVVKAELIPLSVNFAPCVRYDVYIQSWCVGTDRSFETKA